MKYFKLIERDVVVVPMLREIQAHPEGWTLDTGRQNDLGVQRETQSIHLRFHGHNFTGDHKATQTVPFSYIGCPTPIAGLFPRTSAWIDEFIKRMRGRAGRASIVRLGPHSQVHRHIDGRLYYDLRHRYHLVVKSVEGSLLRASNEEVRMMEGEVWWFDNQVPHEAFNNSDEDRIHVIFDILSLRSLGYFFFHAVLWRYPRLLLGKVVRLSKYRGQRLVRNSQLGGQVLSPERTRPKPAD